MAKLDSVIKRSKTSTLQIDKLCNIKTYLSTKEKFEFLEKYNKLLKEHQDDYKGMESFVGFVFFYLLLVKTYTDIEIEMTYECFDQLQENGIINKVVEVIQEDCSLLLKFVRLSEN